MNRQELIARIAQYSGLTKRDTVIFLDSFTNVIGDALAKDESVNLMGFGKFEVRGRPERNGINPQTGDSIIVRASRYPAFKASTVLKRKVSVD